MDLPRAPAEYDQAEQQRMRNAVREAHDQMQMKNQEYIPPRLIMTDTADNKQYVVTLTSGALVFTAL